MRQKTDCRLTQMKRKRNKLIMNDPTRVNSQQKLRSSNNDEMTNPLRRKQLKQDINQEKCVVIGVLKTGHIENRF